MPIKNLGVLDVCIRDNKVYEVRIRIGVDGLNNPRTHGLLDELVNYLQGNLSPEFIIRYLEISPGIMGLAQVAMLSIPRGKVATYAQLARLLGTSPRAVGRLASNNRIPILIPCHRVIKSDGSLGGYSLGIAIKERLLLLEGVEVVNGKVPRQYLVSDEMLHENFRRLSRLII